LEVIVMRNARVIGLFVFALSSLALVPAACTSSTSDPTQKLGFEAGTLDASLDDGSTTTGDGGADGADATPPPPAAGGTGAFGIITINGKQKLYLPLTSFDTGPNATIAVVDVGVAGNGTAGAPALFKTIDLGDPDYATASGGDPNVVIAVSTANRKIRFIDPNTDTLLKTIELPDTFGQSGFSGGGGYVTGVAVDSFNHRAILSVYDGFQIVDLTTMTLGAHIEAAPSENFGFDSVRGRVIAPFYDCTSAYGADGGQLSFCDGYKNVGGETLASSLNVIDLADNTVYTYVNGSAASLDEPLGGELDSASVDPTTGTTVVPSEGNGFQNVIDLAHATFDKASKTFTAPVQVIDGFGYEGVSIAPVGHFALWEGEGTSSIAVADLSQIGKVVQAEMPSLPESTTWSNMGDPHGVAVATGVLDGKPQGFLVSYDRNWVARIDLEGLLGSIQSPEGGSPDGGTAEGFVTYLDATK
jgi:hypothetical protein